MALTGVYHDGQVATLQKTLRVASYSYGGHDFVKLCRYYVRGVSGGMSLESFRRCVRKDVKLTAQMMPDDEVQELFEHVDTSGDG